MRLHRNAMPHTAFPANSGFTLLEVIMVITIIAMLVGLLIPGLSRSRNLAKQTACLAGLQQIGVAIGTYAMENDGSIPYGPKAPPPSATNFYPKTGNVTSLISLESGAPVGLGLLLEKNLSRNKNVLFCPGADEPWNTQETLDRVGQSQETCRTQPPYMNEPTHCQAECSYYYRHASVSTLSGPLPPPMVKLDRLGMNRKGAPIRCLAMDTQFISSDFMANNFNVHTRTHHQQRVVNAVYTDGHGSTHQNVEDRFKVNLSLSVYNTLDRILTIFEELDSD